MLCTSLTAREVPTDFEIFYQNYFFHCRLYSAVEGHLIHELEMEEGVSIQGLACVRSPTILVAMVTSTGVTVVQVRAFFFC